MSGLALTIITTAILCVLWVGWVYRPRYRPCARCGRRVRLGDGNLECSHCGFKVHAIS